MSVKEYARIQEFPDDWVFIGDVQRLYCQIGNAVPVRLGKVAGEVVAEEMDEAISNKMRRIKPGEELTPSKKIYVNSHVHTRHWYRNGKAVVNGPNGEVEYEHKS